MTRLTDNRNEPANSHLLEAQQPLSEKHDALQESSRMPYLSAPTLDDLMRYVLDAICQRGSRILPTRGSAREITGVLLELTNPRARISRTETRGKPFSCLGELCWYLSKTNDLAFIKYYLRAYTKFADGDRIYGGYGPRLFDWKRTNQLQRVTSILRQTSDSRKAVVQLFDANDLAEPHSDVPCTCTLQFIVRGGKLHLLASLRSNDVHWGLPHDVFCFTMLQEIVARALGVDLGTYKQFVGSLHLYDRSRRNAARFLAEGWQSTTIAMPPMPEGDSWPAISEFLRVEHSIRTSAALASPEIFDDMDPYWADLIRLLQVFRARKDRDFRRIRAVKGQMSVDIYSQFIVSILAKSGAR